MIHLRYMKNTLPISFIELTGIPICSNKLDPIVVGIIRYSSFYELICVNGCEMGRIWSTHIGLSKIRSAPMVGDVSFGNTFRCFSKGGYLYNGDMVREFIMGRTLEVPIYEVLFCKVIGCTSIKDAAQLDKVALDRVKSFVGSMGKYHFIDIKGSGELP